MSRRGCRSCGHAEVEHNHVGHECGHENYTETRTEHPDGTMEINSDLRFCGCYYFR